MAFEQTYSLAWSQFSTHYKLIKHVTELSAHSVYGQHSLYLHLPSKQRVLVKEIQFANEDQLSYILEEVKEAAEFNQCASLCKFIKFCVRLQPHVSKSPNQKPYLQKSGTILLLYENQRSLDEIVRQMLISANPRPNLSFQLGLDISPSKFPTFAQITPTAQFFTQKTLQKILSVSLSFVEFLKNEEIDFIKALSFEMIQIHHFGEVDQKCRYFLYPFVENELTQMVKENKIDIEDVFVGENVLKLINYQEQQSATNRIQEKEKARNEFAMIQLDNSPKFGQSQFKQHNSSFKKPESIQSIYVELLQSTGLLLIKLMLLSLSKQRYFKAKLYKMNQRYELVIDFEGIKQVLTEIKNTYKYSKHFVGKVTKLVFEPRGVQSFGEFHQNEPTSNQRHEKSVSVSRSNQRKSVEKNSLRSSKRSGIQITPSKKVGIEASKLKNKSKKELNETLKEKKIFINPYSVQKSKSKPKSASFHLQKPEKIQLPYPKQFSPTLVSKENSSTKKAPSAQKPSPNKNQIEQKNLPQAIVEKLKAKILYDQNGRLYPNMIQKKFRDGSTYYGQYNPKLNIKQGNGLYFYFEGDVYGGTWKNDQLNGLGIYYFVNGDSYEGEVVNGQKDGFGVYHYANGNVYKGLWKHDKKQGEGHMTYANGDSYEGSFVDGRKEGNGMYTWANGDVYEGAFVKNVKHGGGVFKPAHSQNFLQCVWENDRVVDKQTAKIFYKTLNQVFEGQIKSTGVIDGQGRLSFDQNGFYQGSIKNNSFEGQCCINYPNGDVYKGQVSNNLFEGYGEYYFASKKLTYAGQWREGLQHDSGKLISEDGTAIFSSWQSGVMGSKGIITYGKNERYEGEITENGRHGVGKYFFRNGEWVEGRFQNNQLAEIYRVS